MVTKEFCVAIAYTGLACSMSRAVVTAESINLLILLREFFCRFLISIFNKDSFIRLILKLLILILRVHGIWGNLVLVLGILELGIIPHLILWRILNLLILYLIVNRILKLVLRLIISLILKRIELLVIKGILIIALRLIGLIIWWLIISLVLRIILELILRILIESIGLIIIIECLVLVLI